MFVTMIIKTILVIKKWATFTNLFELLTMTGALISEFSLRVQLKMLLVYIAMGIVIFSAINIFILNYSKTKNKINNK